MRFHSSLPVLTYMVSMIARMKARPRVSGTNSQWYIAVSANWARDQPTSVMSIFSIMFIV